MVVRPGPRVQLVPKAPRSVPPQQNVVWFHDSSTVPAQRLSLCSEPTCSRVPPASVCSLTRTTTLWEGRWCALLLRASLAADRQAVTALFDAIRRIADGQRSAAPCRWRWSRVREVGVRPPCGERHRGDLHPCRGGLSRIDALGRALPDGRRPLSAEDDPSVTSVASSASPESRRSLSRSDQAESPEVGPAARSQPTRAAQPSPAQRSSARAGCGRGRWRTAARRGTTKSCRWAAAP